MRIQSSSKESRWCNCGKQILTTDMRFIDNGVHVCIECRNKELNAMNDKNLTKSNLEEVKVHFIIARDSLIDAASILQQSKTFESTTKDTKEVIGDLCIAIKALNLV